MEKVMAIVNGEALVDYAYPAMKAERGLKTLHEAALERDYDRAIEVGMLALADLKLTVNALKVMKEKDAQNRMVVQQPENIPTVSEEVLPHEGSQRRH